MSITTAEAERIGVMAARLRAGSSGQVLSSARALNEALDAHGLRIGDLIADVLRPRVAAIGTSTADHAQRARAMLTTPWCFSVFELQFLFDLTHLPALTSGHAAKFDRLRRRIETPALR